MRALVLLLIAACGGPDEIDPGDATPQNLYGTWKIEGTDSADRPRYLSFYERFDAHPMVEGLRDVHLRYLVDASGTQMLLEVGTFAVVDGVLELTPFGGLSPNDRPYATTITITNLAPDSYLELAGISGSPVAHTKLARCDSPAFADGWIGYDLSRAVYDFTNIGGGPQAMTLSYLSDGTLVGGARTGYFRFDKECVPETVGRGGTGERIVLKTSDGVILATGRAFGASSPIRYGHLRAGDALSGVTWRELGIQEADARVIGVVADQLVIAYATQSPPGYAVAVDDGTATTITQLPEFFTPGTIADVRRHTARHRPGHADGRARPHAVGARGEHGPRRQPRIPRGGDGGGQGLAHLRRGWRTRRRGERTRAVADHARGRRLVDAAVPRVGRQAHARRA
ncbi:hypothetical protein [Nannocystis pusilla]|uniref:hypothetical protein n=1 Tax=Nannocystis pusilla TaxID=889268 RepID=UPI003DA4AB02